MLRYKAISASTVSSSGAAAGGVSCAVPSATAYDHPLRERFGYDAWALIYDVDTVRTIVAAYPFECELEGYQSYVTFVADAAILDELSALADTAGPDENISRGPDPLGVLYWQVPKGSTLDSTIGQTMGKKRYKSSTTTRNLRTLAKVLR